MRKGVLLKKYSEDVKTVKIFGLNDFYRFMECDLIDIMCMPIGGKYYDIIVDEEFLFDSELVTTVVDKKGNTIAYGNIIVLGDGSETGTSPSLTTDDIQNIRRHLYPVTHKNGKHGKVLVVDGYLAYF